MSSDWKSIFADARLALLVLGASALLAGTLAFGSGYALTRLEQTLAQANNALAVQQETLAQNHLDLADIEKHLPEFRKLLAGGMMGSGEREGWIEQLLVNQQRLGLPSTLKYALAPPRAYTVDNGMPENAATAANPPPPGGGIMTHDLLIELNDVHESDVLNLLEAYRRDVKGQFRIQELQLTQPGDKGLAARCLLRFFTFAETPSA